MQLKKTEKTELGLKGEEIACKYLTKLGYSIIERNWRYKHKEIDIIMKQDSLLIIVEVKTRSSLYFERPQDAVTIQKQKFLISAANGYIENIEFDGEVRFDIVTVLLENGKEKIEHIPDAFYPLV